MTTATQEPPESPSPERPSISDLLGHEAFVRSLARKLLGDPHAAEDLVQETWVRALQSPPKHAASLRGWLSRVVRNLAANTQASVGRRPKTTELIDTYSRSPSAAETLALGMLRGDLSSALGRLSEEQRDVIVRRHFDDLPPREIARVASVPVETVRTRYKRGMAQLRERLDREYGRTGAIWILGLTGGGLRMPTPLSPSGPAEAGTGTMGSGASGAATGGTAATGTAVFSLLRAAVWIALPLVAAGTVWWAVASPDRDTLALAGETEQGGVEVAGLAGPIAPTRVGAAGAAPNVKPARLTIQVTERGSGDAVAKLPVQVISLAHPGEPLETVVTDRRGRATIKKLLPGTYRLRPERGSSIARTLRDGEKAELAIVVPPLRELGGRVIDAEDEPVAGAEIFASLPNDPTRCRPIGISDADGRFELDGIDPNAWMCARAPLDGSGRPRFADSEMVFLDDPGHRPDGRELTLQFRYPSSSIVGEVLDDDGQPLPGAQVRALLGSSSWLDTGVAGPTWPVVRLDGTLALNAPMREVRTDDAGQFELGGLREGIYSLWVSAEGRAPWQLDVKVARASESDFVRIALAPGAELVGTLRTPAGHAAENATVTVNSVLPNVTRVVTTDRRGRFRLTGLPADEVKVHAWLIDGKEPIHASVTLDLEAGQIARWEPLLTPGGAIQGTAVDLEGRPLTGWVVAIEREDWIGAHGARTIAAPRVAVREVSTDDEGRFTLPGCDAGFYFVTLFDPDAPIRVPLTWQSGVVPDAEPIRLAIGAKPRGSLSGKVVSVDDVPVKKVELLVDTLMLPQQLRLPVGADGTFHVEGLPPGQFTLRAWGDGIPLQLAAGGKLKPGEDRDLGDVRLERPSRATIFVRRADGSLPDEIHMKLMIESSKPLMVSSTSPMVGFAFGDQGDVAIGPIPRGRYAMRIWTDDGEYSRLSRFALGPGQDKSVTVELQPAVQREFLLHCPPHPKHRGLLVVTILDDDGEQVDQRFLNYVGDTDKELRLAFHLPPGSYGLEARINGRDRAKIQFDHAPDASELIEVDLR